MCKDTVNIVYLYVQGYSKYDSPLVCAWICCGFQSVTCIQVHQENEEVIGSAISRCHMKMRQLEVLPADFT